MARLVNDLLSFPRIRRVEDVLISVDLAAMARKIMADLAPEATSRTINWKLENSRMWMPTAPCSGWCSPTLLAYALEFTRPRSGPFFCPCHRSLAGLGRNKNGPCYP